MGPGRSREVASVLIIIAIITPSSCPPQDPPPLDTAVQHALAGLYPPFEATAPTVLGQVFRLLDSDFQGDGLSFLLDFLIPAKRLCEQVREAACVSREGNRARGKAIPESLGARGGQRRRWAGMCLVSRGTECVWGLSKYHCLPKGRFQPPRSRGLYPVTSMSSLHCTVTSREEGLNKGILGGSLVLGSLPCT